MRAALYRLRCTACKEVAICRNPITAPTLGPDAALDDCLGDTPDGDNVCRSPIVTAVLLGSVVYLVKRLHHRLLQPTIHFGLVPKELLQVLYPFEIGDSHTAGIGEDVGQHHHLFTTEHEVGFRCRRAVGGFGDDLGPDIARVLNCDLILQGRGNQNVALRLQHVVAGNRAASGKRLHAASRCLKTRQGGNVDPLLVKDAAFRVADANHSDPSVPEQSCHHAADVAEALDGDSSSLQVDAPHFAGFAEDEETSPRSGFEAAERTAKEGRLAGDDRGSGVTCGHAVGVHDPRHGLRVGIYVGRGDVLVGPDQRRDLIGIAASEPLQFIPRQTLGIAADTALGAPEGYVYQGALPRHPGSQGRHFVEGDAGMIADSTFVRSAYVAVLHAVGIEDADGAVVHLDGKSQRNGAAGTAQYLTQSRIEFQVVRGNFELLGHNV